MNNIQNMPHDVLHLESLQTYTNFAKVIIIIINNKQV